MESIPRMFNRSSRFITISSNIQGEEIVLPLNFKGTAKDFDIRSPTDVDFEELR